MTGDVLWVLTDEPDETTIQAMLWVESDFAGRKDPHEIKWIVPMDGPMDPGGLM